jgi:hypothetical protein
MKEWQRGAEMCQSRRFRQRLFSLGEIDGLRRKPTSFWRGSPCLRGAKSAVSRRGTRKCGGALLVVILALLGGSLPIFG